MIKFWKSKYRTLTRLALFASLTLAPAILAGFDSLHTFQLQSLPGAATNPSATAEAQRLFNDRHLTGAAVAQDVKSGAQLVSFSSDSASAKPDFLPLSIVKLFLFASYWEHHAALPASITADPRELIAEGSDSTGRHLALALRHSLGSRALLRDLNRFGFPRCTAIRAVDCTSLAPDTTDEDWADAMSIGESNFHVTLLGLSQFIAAIGNRGFSPGLHTARIMREQTSQQLQSAMLGTVNIGTASGIRDRLGSLGHLGGKTGSGPGDANPTDGIFAALVFDSTGAARYSIVTYVRRGGHGGGAAAEISADIAKFLLSNNHE
jgi:cell division protein FtsI/penicillin-binding protein 2